jgi:hypothetical protein
MQMALGAGNAWSGFRIPLSRTYGWTVLQVTVTFEVAILVLGFAAFAGGLWMRHSGLHPPVVPPEASAGEPDLQGARRRLAS